MPKEEFIEITEITDGKKTQHKYPNFEPELSVKPQTTKWFFYTFNWISLLFCLTFIILIFLEKPLPEYFIGFIGSIIGYFIAKRPYEL